MNDTHHHRKSWLKRQRRTLLIAGPVVVLLAVGFFYITGGRYVSTDDAYVQAARTDISANIAGRVTEIDVHDNQAVKKGDVLFKLDDRDYTIAVNDAKAKLAAAKLQIAALQATYKQRAAGTQAASDTLAYRQSELERQKTLAAQGISSQAQLDQANHAVLTAQQQLAAAQQEQENVRASLGDDPDAAVEDHPLAQQAQAALDRAELDLSHTVITAPADGIVAKVEQLQAGQYIKAAAPVFALLSDTDIWVEANFKETDLTYMQPGQDATIEVDIYPDRTFRGKVESASPGTGASFSLLPPENASGNWVKVVQRLPVRIRIEDADLKAPLQSGLSAVVTVDTHHSRLESFNGGRS
jgi:membrane fusion protein (multidrug efflux system)